MDLEDIIRDNPLLAAGASFWIPGLGQILCGRIKRGIMLLIPSFIVNIGRNLLWMVKHILIMLGLEYGPYGLPLWNAASYGINILSGFLVLIVRIWATYDAYRIAKQG